MSQTGPGAARQPSGTAASVAWAVLAGLAVAFLVADLVGAVVLLATGPRDSLWIAPFTALGAWWVYRGAFLRTMWGRPDAATDAPWEEPVLTERRATLYVRLGLGVVLLAGLALVLQLNGFQPGLPG